MDLDLHVAKLVFAARLLERALHDRGPWEMSWGPFTVPAHRMIDTDAVTFSAVFPAACHLERPEDTVYLLCDGEVVGSREIDFPGDSPFTLLWRIAGEKVEATA